MGYSLYGDRGGGGGSNITCSIDVGNTPGRIEKVNSALSRGLPTWTSIS